MTIETPARPQARIARLLPAPGPGRLLALTSLIASVGIGLYTSGIAVYLVGYLKLSATQVGSGMSLGGLAGFVLGPFLGHAADRVGPRAATMAFTATEVVLIASLGGLRSPSAVILVLALLGIAQSGEGVSRGALLTRLMGRNGRVRLMAYLRSVSNLGFTVGVLFAGLVLALNTRAAYLSLIWGYALMLAVVTTGYLFLPAVRGVAARKDGASGLGAALRDLPYLVAAQVSGLTRLGDTVFTLAVPLWIIGHTKAPRAIAAWIIGVNTVLVILLQVRAARAANEITGAVRLQRWSFLALTAACVTIAFTGGLPAWGVVAVLLLAVVGISFGEMWGEAARWSLQFGLAPPDAQGQYGGVFRLGQLMPSAVGPVLVTSLTAHLGSLGWLLIGAVFVAGVLLNGAVMPWVLRKSAARITS